MRRTIPPVSPRPMVEPLEERLLLARLVGIDVASYQGVINWATVKQTKQFAMIRAGTSKTPVDPKLDANAKGAIANGMYAGFYYYAYYDEAGNAAPDEADLFWNAIKPYVKADGKHLMPVLDIEQGDTVFGGGTVSDWVNAFCARLTSNAAGAGFAITPIIYTGASNAGTLYDATIPQRYPLWVAQWPSTLPDPQAKDPSGSGDWQTWQFWQYADDGTVGGIGGAVDLDVLNGDANKIKSYVIGSAGRWDDGDWVTPTTTVKAWNTSAANGTFTNVAAGVVGKVLTGPIYGNSYWRWQVQFNNGVTGWVAEDLMASATPALPTAPTPANSTASLAALPANFTWTGSRSTKYDVYLDGVKQSTVTAASWAHGAIANGGHTWRVDARNAELTTTGTTWSFAINVDNVPPTATYGGQTPTPGASTFDFTITYADAANLVNAATFDSGDVTVTTPGGSTAPAMFVSATPAGNGASRTVTYRISAPGGTWNLADNGNYTIKQVAGQVADTLGNARPAGTIAALAVNVPFAWQAGGVVTAEFDGSATPIGLTINGANLSATRNGATLNFAGATGVVVRGTSAADTLTLAGDAAAAAPITLNFAAGGDVLNVAGKATFAADLAATAPNLTVNVTASGDVTFAATQHLAALKLTGGGTARLADGGNRVLVLGALDVSGGGALDLADGDMIVTATSIAAVSALLQTGYANGAWSGPGINSATAATTQGTGLAVAPAAALYASFPATFHGQSIDASSVLVRYTLQGDANLDRAIEFADLVVISQNYGLAPATYAQGDFNYDGVTDFADLVMVAQNYDTALPAPPAAAPAKATTNIAKAVETPKAIFSVTPVKPVSVRKLAPLPSRPHR